MAPHGRYIAVETAVSTLINAALSLLAAWLVFGGRTSIEAAGPRGFAMDFLPQTFMVSFMSTLIPTWLTRRRVRAGEVERGTSPASRLPRNLLVRALVSALAMTLVLGVAAMLLAPRLWGQPLPLAGLFGLKVAYGALISVPVTRFALRAALAD
jgi:hypothetical protein